MFCAVNGTIYITTLKHENNIDFGFGNQLTAVMYNKIKTQVKIFICSKIA